MKVVVLHAWLPFYILALWFLIYCLMLAYCIIMFMLFTFWSHTELRKKKEKKRWMQTDS